MKTIVSNNKKIILGIIVLLFYVNLLPFVCRIWKGLDWMTQYLPEMKNLVLGIIFLVFCGSIAAIPLIIIFLLKKHTPVTNVISIICTSILLIYWHHDYDLSSDAQAAIGLIINPVYTVGITTLVAVLSTLIEIFMIWFFANEK